MRTIFPFFNLTFIYILLSIILFSCKPVSRQEVESVRPNIIFLFTDDQRDNTFGIMGHPVIKSPNVDKLIQSGVRFSNTYIAEPVCSPSRVSIFTGVHERVHGVGFTSSFQLTEEQWGATYPAILRRNGYFTGFVGKFGVEYYTFKGKTSERFDYWYGHDGWTKFFPKDFKGNSTSPYHGAQDDIISPIMGEGIEKFLDTLPVDKPFCLSVSFNVPHGSQTTSMYTDYQDWHSMKRPANENSKLKGHVFYDNLYRDINIGIPDETATDPYQYIPEDILDQDKGRRNQTYIYDYNRETCREHYIRYYQQITGLDHIIGKMMESIEKRGLADNTIIIFGSDHGLLMGEYGMGGKALLYDLTSKIPCFIYDPRLPETERGKTVDKLVSSLDITTTILDYAGIRAPDHMEGQSLVPLVEGKQVKWREELFLESLFTMRDNPFCEGMRIGDWKYIRMFDGVIPYTDDDVTFNGQKPGFEQLFNLKEDPEEMINLVDEHEGTQFLEEFRQKTQVWSDSLNERRTWYKNNFECISR